PRSSERQRWLRERTRFYSRRRRLFFLFAAGERFGKWRFRAAHLSEQQLSAYLHASAIINHASFAYASNLPFFSAPDFINADSEQACSTTGYLEFAGTRFRVAVRPGWAEPIIDSGKPRQYRSTQY